jgi:uncharacterized protein DUF6265
MRIATLLLFAALSARAADLPSWMRGSWHSESAGTRMEEHWTSAGGGAMLGMHRDVDPKGKLSFEFLRIEQKDGSLVYLAMPSGRPATPFPLKTLTATRVVFENPEHDFPQRIIYWRDGKRLCARVEGTIGGKEESEEWCWNRFNL